MSFDYFKLKYFLKFLSFRTISPIPVVWNGEKSKFEPIKTWRKIIYWIIFLVLSIIYFLNLLIQTWLNFNRDEHEISIYEKFLDLLYSILGFLISNVYYVFIFKLESLCLLLNTIENINNIIKGIPKYNNN